MANYRFYVLDKDDHVRKPPQVFECRSDEAAVEKAVSIAQRAGDRGLGSLSSRFPAGTDG